MVGRYVLVAVVVGLAARPVAAQRRVAIQAAVGSGGSVAGAADGVVALRTPTFFDVGLITWSEDDPAWWFGGGIRGEFESRASIGGVVRVGAAATVGPLVLRPLVGVVAFFAPFTLIGAEAGLDIAWRLVDLFAVVARLVVDGHFAGSDLPANAALVMFNGALGVEVAF